MPHVRYSGSLDLVGFHRAFSPRALEEPGLVAKATACYLDHEGQTLLVDCTTVEGRLRQNYFAVATVSPDGSVVRLLPKTSPEKSPGVFRTLAWIAQWLAASSGGKSIQSSNLGAALETPFPAHRDPKIDTRADG